MGVKKKTFYMIVELYPDKSEGLNSHWRWNGRRSDPM